MPKLQHLVPGTIGLLMVALFGASPLIAQHPSAAYEAVLAEIQREFPDSGLLLMNWYRRDSEGTRTDTLLHPPDWLEQLQSRGVLVGWCIPPENAIGCASPIAPPGPTITFGLSPLETNENAQPEVNATFVLVSDYEGRLYVEGRTYTLRETEGQWEVISCRVTEIS